VGRCRAYRDHADRSHEGGGAGQRALEGAGRRYDDRKPTGVRGWKVFHSYCDRCHGQDATGSSFAPNLRQSVGANGMTESAFAAAVADGRPDKGMPAFKTMITDAQIGQLYAYVKTRSAGTLGPGRPKRAS